MWTANRCGPAVSEPIAIPVRDSVPPIHLAVDQVDTYKQAGGSVSFFGYQSLLGHLDELGYSVECTPVIFLEMSRSAKLLPLPRCLVCWPATLTCGGAMCLDLVLPLCRNMPLLLPISPTRLSPENCDNDSHQRLQHSTYDEIEKLCSHIRVRSDILCTPLTIRT